jgi:hypothetical protein
LPKKWKKGQSSRYKPIVKAVRARAVWASVLVCTVFLPHELQYKDFPAVSPAALDRHSAMVLKKTPAVRPLFQLHGWYFSTNTSQFHSKRNTVIPQDVGMVEYWNHGMLG